MSVARITTVGRSRKPYVCGSCRETIPVGSSYRWFAVGFRGRPQIRCMKTTCTPRTSQLESSQLSEAYAARENAQDQLATMTEVSDLSDLQNVLDEFKDAIESVKDIYREADENFGGGGMTENAERADNLEAVMDEIDSVSLDDWDDNWCEKHESADTALELDEQFTESDNIDAVREACDDCIANRETWWKEQVEAVENAINDANI